MVNSQERLQIFSRLLSSKAADSPELKKGPKQVSNTPSPLIKAGLEN